MQQVFDIAAVEDVVVVGERDVLAMRGIEAGVLGLGDAAVFLMDHGDAAVYRHDHGNEGSGVVWQGLCFLFVYADVSSMARFLAELRRRIVYRIA